MSDSSCVDSVESPVPQKKIADQKNREYRLRHPDRVAESARRRIESGKQAAYHRKWRLANPGAQAAYTRDWRSRNPEKVKENAWKQNSKARFARFKLSKVAFEKMFIAQCGSCACCGKVFEENQRVNVDHDWACCVGRSRGKEFKLCGKCNRGLVCHTCNLAIGFYERHHENVEAYIALGRLPRVTTREHGLQYSEVSTATESLRARGELVSPRPVLVFLGRGKMEEVKVHLAEWFKHQPPVVMHCDIEKTPAIDRFMQKVEIIPNGCWEWRAHKDPKGYGRFGEEGKAVQASRFSYEHHIGEIPEGLQINPTCKNPGCVNPAHLEAVTAREACIRGNSFAAQQARQTHCIHGHPFDEANTRMKGNHRVCRKCHAASVNAAKKRKRVARDQAQPAEG